MPKRWKMCLVKPKFATKSDNWAQATEECPTLYVPALCLVGLEVQNMQWLLYHIILKIYIKSIGKFMDSKKHLEGERIWDLRNHPKLMNPTCKNGGFMWINFGSKTPPNSQLLKDFWGFLLRHPILIKWLLLWDCCKGMVGPKVSVLNISCFFFTTYRGFSKAARMENIESFQNMNRIVGRKVIHHKDAQISLVLHMFQRTFSPENEKTPTNP